MNTTIDPKTFDLHRSTIIEKDEKGCLTLIINRKSRIIMADGKKIMSKIEKIKSSLPGVVVNIKTSAPLCSKTRTWLEKHQVTILEI